MSEYNKSLPVRNDSLANSEDLSQLIGIVSTNINFSQDIMSLEIVNNSDTATIFLNIAGGTSIVSLGIPIYPKQYYSADRKIKQDIGISLISSEVSTDVRIVGHFNFEVEN